VAASLGIAGTVDAATLRIAWDPSSDPAVVGYMVSMGTRSGVYAQRIDAGLQTLEEFSDLTVGATYYFVVQSYDRLGNLSAPSAEVAGIAPSSSALSIMCPAPSTTSSNGGPVPVTFSASGSGGSGLVTTTCSYPSGTLFPVGSTSVVCTATDAAGSMATCATTVTVSASTTTSTPTPTPAAASPSGPSGLVSTVIGATVLLRWAPPTSFPTASYIIEAGSTPGSSDQAYIETGSPVGSYTAYPVSPGVYFVRARARSADGALSGASNETVVNVPCPPVEAPSRLSAATDGSTVTLSWQAGGPGGSFIVEAGSAPGGSDAASFDTQSSSTSYTAIGVVAGTYFVRLRATNACGARSAPSNEIVVTVGR